MQPTIVLPLRMSTATSAFTLIFLRNAAQIPELRSAQIFLKVKSEFGDLHLTSVRFGVLKKVFTYALPGNIPGLTERSKKTNINITNQRFCQVLSNFIFIL